MEESIELERSWNGDEIYQGYIINTDRYIKKYIVPKNILIIGDEYEFKIERIYIYYSYQCKKYNNSFDVDEMCNIFNDFNVRHLNTRSYNLHFTDVFHEYIPLTDERIEIRVICKGNIQNIYCTYTTKINHMYDSIGTFNPSHISFLNIEYLHKVIGKHCGFFINQEKIDEIYKIRIFIDDALYKELNYSHIFYEINCKRINDKIIYINFGEQKEKLHEIFYGQKNAEYTDGCNHINFDIIKKFEVKITQKETQKVNYIFLNTERD